MSFRFTRSKDGVKRVSIRVDYRLSEDELEKIRRYLYLHDGDRSKGAVREFLSNCLDIGLIDYSQTFDEMDEGQE